MLPNDGYIAPELWDKDHWSQMGYMDSVMIESSGFQVGYDPRMRQGRRNYRVMVEQMRHPKRASGRSPTGVVMDNRYSTRIKGDEQVEGHDDWHCVQDMIAAGMVGIIDANAEGGALCDMEAMEPGAILTFTPLGWEVSNQLRQHKTNGGRWSTFAIKESACLTS